MSLDLWLQKPECSLCKHTKSTDIHNYTYNVGDMWREIYPGESMVQIDGMTGAESIIKIQNALDKMHLEEEKFIAMNPENGWGDYFTFIRYLRLLVSIARENPDWIWHACR